MATVSKWTPFGVALNITATAGTVTRTSATQYKVTINASWETYYSGAKTNYGMDATSGGSGVTINIFGTKSDSGHGTFTGTYSISGNGSASKTITVTFKNFNSDNGKSATKTVSFTVNVPAWTSYIIKYNGNGGSNVPGNQTKWKDQTLILSYTKPTRNGYGFEGWATTSNATKATYGAGDKYTANSAAILYAVWNATRYAVRYNANGGTGAPEVQEKIYGKTLTLSSTKPTRTNYNFKGWGTSASSTTVTYAPGASYTKNAGITLYAIWELAYTKPRITNVSVTRCDSSGTATDEGQNAYVKCNAEYDLNFTAAFVEWKLASESTWSTANRKDLNIYIDINIDPPILEPLSTSMENSSSGDYWYAVIGDNTLDPEKTYDIRITFTDAGGSTSVTTSFASMKFPIDILNQGKGIAFGKTAETENTAEFAYEAKFNSPVYGKALGMDKLPSIPANSDLNNYMEPGCYAVRRNDVATTCTNIPVESAGRLEVWSSTGEGVRTEQYLYLRQRYIPYNDTNAVWERDITRRSDNVWRYYDWWRSSLTPAVSKNVYHEQKILWGENLTSGMYMTASHTINLSEAVSTQPNGIVLVFCAYNGTDNTNYSWESFFVPKQLVALSTSGHTFILGQGKFTYVGTKYLYINDTSITGHDDNNLTGSNNGITYANNKFVLRYVIGI